MRWSEASWRSLAGVASLPAAAGHVSIGAAILAGRWIGEALRVASRALDHTATNAAEVELIHDAARARSRPGQPGLAGRPADALAEAHLADESQWIVWSDDSVAGDWAAAALRFDWGGLDGGDGAGPGDEPRPAA